MYFEIVFEFKRITFINSKMFTTSVTAKVEDKVLDHLLIIRNLKGSA